MMWKKGKTFKKGNKTVRYIYKNGKSSTKKLVTVKSSRSTSKKKSNYRRRY
jgi:hypothetical protein